MAVHHLSGCGIASSSQSCCRIRRFGRLILLVSLVVSAFSSLHDPAAGAQVQPDWRQAYTLVLMSTSDIAVANQARNHIVANGGRIAVLVPPHVMLGWIPANLHDGLIGTYGIERITQRPVDPATLAYKDAATLAAVSAFNAVVAPPAAAAGPLTERADRPSFTDTVFDHPSLDYQAYRDNLARFGLAVHEQPGGTALAAAPGNADSMTGSVAVAIFFVESDGTIDPDRYTWSQQDEQDAFNQALSGLSWWSAQAPLYGASVTFTVFRYASTDPVCRQPYEPVLQTDDQLWINPIMDKLGFTSGRKAEKVTAFNTVLKARAGSDWAYSAFVINYPVPYDSNPKGYAYLGGPYTHQKYGADHVFAQMFAHETGHIFWALDEYTATCNCGVCGSGPRPEVLNANCRACSPDRVACIMDGGWALCPYTALQLGWSSPAVGIMHVPIVYGVATGYEGGPLDRSSFAYEVHNPGPQPVDWSVSADAPWLSFSSSAGRLEPFSSVRLTVSLNEQAKSLITRGNYELHSAEFQFRNLTNGYYDRYDWIILDVVRGGVPLVFADDALFTPSGMVGGSISR